MNVLKLKICDLFNATVGICFFKPTLKIQKRFTTKVHRLACYLGHEIEKYWKYQFLQKHLDFFC